MEIKIDFKRFERGLTAMRKDTFPLVVSDTLSEVAKAASEYLSKDTLTSFDSPNKFTQSGFGFTRSNKRTLVAEVYVKDIQSQYLRKQMEGGDRQRGDHAVSDTLGVVLPGPDGKRTAFGGVPRGYVSRQVRGKTRFIGEIGGVRGLWERPKYKKIPKGKKRRAKFFADNTNRKLKLLAVFEDKVQYKPNWDFFGKVSKVNDDTITEAFKAAFKKHYRL